MDCVFVNTIEHIIEITQPISFLRFHTTVFLCLKYPKYLKIYKTKGKKNTNTNIIQMQKEKKENRKETWLEVTKHNRCV